MKNKTDSLKIGFDWEPKESKPKKLLPTKPYGQLISYISFVDGKEKWGVYTHTEGENLYCYWGRYYSEEEAKGYIPTDILHRVVDVVVHEPKEQNLSAAQELSVQQESANFAHVAVQGIINAHAIKEMEDSHESRLKQMGVAPKPIFTFDDFDLSVNRTWKKQDFKDAVSNAALGLTGEAGEVADLIKKGVYHGRGFTPDFAIPDNGEIDTGDVKDELSDVLFYVSAMAQEFGFTLEDIAKHNREKLEKRFPEGFSTEASAQKKDRAPEVKPKGEIRIGYSKHYKEDTLEYVGVDKAPFSVTYFYTDYELKKTLKELREGSRVTIEDKHEGEFKFTKVGNLMRVHFKDLEGELDSHTCLVKVSYEEVTD
ncbi:nucleoside triphosphate pyrophosphohydrolase family protein [Bacillus sp. TH13]|uniref:nucleoside triphosphate pyrophosphohydrolase family protein n=1 Tax=Bacillus sp. TH13 TaxID=2796379 RepID=UPI001913E54C|nr:nucleoside triphosphate pyrophosphohydrolase family protein [Bacillus sp. TH13]MBK5492585.1 nucleoside triphosphate pyrophosphohydrolase family protein [Bacillus sp. TH13]